MERKPIQINFFNRLNGGFSFINQVIILSSLIPS
nr:MAG TPA: hypothetical protein [Caudoviricetes sp.]